MEKQEGFVVRPHQDWWGTKEDRDLHIVLWRPEIPGNTGNIGRLCAGAAVWLHLVRPLGFELDNKYLRRAGLDYWPDVKLSIHDSLDEITATFPRERMFFFTKKATHCYADVEYPEGAVLVFGRETRGLSSEILEEYDDRALYIPNTPNVRSLNLSNACAVAVYEALRQHEWEPVYRCTRADGSGSS